jgi:hypothetical protein
VDFDILFYANGQNAAVGLDSLTMSIYDTDGDSDRADFSDGEDGDAYGQLLDSLFTEAVVVFGVELEDLVEDVYTDGRRC